MPDGNKLYATLLAKSDYEIYRCFGRRILENKLAVQPKKCAVMVQISEKERVFLCELVQMLESQKRSRMLWGYSKFPLSAYFSARIWEDGDRMEIL